MVFLVNARSRTAGQRRKTIRTGTTELKKKRKQEAGASPLEAADRMHCGVRR
jgi:hypothetical protein